MQMWPGLKIPVDSTISRKRHERRATLPASVDQRLEAIGSVEWDDQVLETCAFSSHCLKCDVWHKVTLRGVISDGHLADI